MNSFKDFTSVALEGLNRSDNIRRQTKTRHILIHIKTERQTLYVYDIGI